jgi:integrase
MAKEKLTALQVEKAKIPGLINDGGGLYLRVAPGGTKGWILRYKFHGRQRDMGLGPLDIIGLKEARARAQRCRQLLYDGIDPIEERRSRKQQARLEAAKSMTFRECGAAFIAANQSGWRNAKHAAQWPSTLETYVYPVIGMLPVQAIDVGLVMRCLEPIWFEKPETASRVRGRIEKILGWATTRGYRQGENPARWRDNIANLVPKKSRVAKVTHHAALSYAELPAFMAELRAQDSLSAKALEFTILTVARTGETIGARFAEIDVANRLWTVPASRMKGGREHRVPLSAAAFAIVETMQQQTDSDHIFSGPPAAKPLSNMALLMLLRRMGRDELTVHGFRSSFRDWCAETTRFPAEVAEMALAHKVGDKVEAAYRRGDLFVKRRELAEAWATFCSSSSTGTPHSDVVPLRATIRL